MIDEYCQMIGAAGAEVDQIKKTMLHEREEFQKTNLDVMETAALQKIKSAAI